MADDDQRTRLIQAKLVALVGEHTGDRSGTPGGHAGAGTLLQGDIGWWLAHTAPGRTLGPALAWGQQQGVRELHVLVDDPNAAATVARRATAFADPPTVWRVDGRTLHAAEPADPQPPLPPPTGVETLVALIEAAGIDVVVEHGVVTGEWLGLEVARIVDGPDGPRLDVGVGRHDREAFTLMHGEVPRAEALQAVVDAARRHRAPDSEAHPLGRLVPERWLRALLLDQPALAGAGTLAAVEPIVPRDSVKDVIPAGAAGPARSGDEAVVVVTSVGVDLDLVPEAADLRIRHDQGRSAASRLVLVVPERDALSVTRRMAERLVLPAEIVTVPVDWRVSVGSA